MILITGATGNVAGALIPTLLQSGQQVRALVHDEAKAQGLKDQGAEVVVADLEKPQTLDAAVAGVDKIYLLPDNGPNGGQHGINLIDAVKRSGSLPHIVRHSAFGDSRSRLIAHHEQVEAALAESGLPVTTLRPTFFMQNIMGGAQSLQQMATNLQRVAATFKLGDDTTGGTPPPVETYKAARVADTVVEHAGEPSPAYAGNGHRS